MSRRRAPLDQETQIQRVQNEIRAEKRAVLKKKRRRRLRRLGILSFLILVVAGSVYIDQQPFSRVLEVEVVGNHYINSDIIIAESQVAVQDRLIFTLSPFIERRISKIPGIAFAEVNVYYTKGKVVLNVKEKNVVAYMNEGPTVLFEDGAFTITSSTSVADYPLLVDFTDAILQEHPEFADKLSRLDSTAYYNISEIHVVPNEYETLYMSFIMNNGFKVFTSVENMMLMNHYTEIVSSILSGDKPDNRCIYFLDYYEDVPDSQVSIARPCQ